MVNEEAKDIHLPNVLFKSGFAILCSKIQVKSRAVAAFTAIRTLP